MILNVGGIVDRIDILNGTARVVDYKTGSVSESPGTPVRSFC
ncbi:MAG: PD-(D/E)XK nuclease family protein [Bacteroidetes bacterium]|nr:PD-(D/E)XK nuclease family protein [Bacteroidota bacterium]